MVKTYVLSGFNKMIPEKPLWDKVSNPFNRSLVVKVTKTAQSFDQTAFLQKTQIKTIRQL
ncbi:hypothetical protein DBR40_08800 [Pedobacter sp. KBW01]|nr:hypothetical protein DBR40_08800 [Pedobacter sp. KBW01]